LKEDISGGKTIDTSKKESDYKEGKVGRAHSFPRLENASSNGKKKGVDNRGRGPLGGEAPFRRDREKG